MSVLAPHKEWHMFGRDWRRKWAAAKHLEKLRAEYSLEQLQLRIGGDIFSRVEPAYAALESVPQMWSGISQGRRVSVVSNEWDFACAARKNLMEHSEACGMYVFNGTSSLLEGKSLEDAVTITVQRGARIAGVARTTVLDFRMNVIRLEHHAVFGARPKPDGSQDSPEWFARRMMSSNELWESSRRGEYPHHFEETRQQVIDAINTAKATELTQWNRQMKKVWDEVAKLHETVPVLEAFWDELVERTPRLLGTLDSRTKHP